MPSQSQQQKEQRQAVEAAVESRGPTGRDVFAERADDVVPEKDDMQKAYKRQLQAKSAHEEAKVKAERVRDDSSPDAQDTPSGAALLAVEGIADDEERGEAYARARAAVRHTPGGDPQKLAKAAAKD